jgi:hypothetical protein
LASVGPWVVAALVVGMALATADGGTAEVVATHAYAEPHTVYNLTVDDVRVHRWVCRPDRGGGIG